LLLLLLLLTLYYLCSYPSVSYGHLVAVDHVKSSVSVSDRFRFATAVVVDEAGARGRTGPVVGAAALWVHQECRRSLRDDFARLAPAAGLQLQRQQQEINNKTNKQTKYTQWGKSTTSQHNGKVRPR
jgi:orotidine-5'-phosphate decarboxylase